MPVLTSSVLFVGAHRGVDSPDDPNLFSADEIAAYAVPSTSASAAVSIVTSQVASGGLGSVPISTADSKAVSSGLRASVSDSKAVSGSTNTSVADSKSISNSVNISVADSKATSVGAATFVPTVGSIPGFLQNGTGAVIRTANGKMAEQFSVKDFDAKGDGVTNDTTAIQNAAAAACAYSLANSTGAELIFPVGTYVLTDTVLITSSRVHIRGAGKYATTIAFTPTSAKACFKFRNATPASVLYQCSLQGMGFSGGGSQQKIAIDCWDCSEQSVRDIAVFSTWTGNSGSTATPSIGVRTQGREFFHLHRATIAADRPVHLMANINGGANNVDHYHLTDVYYLTLVTTEACILIDPDVSPTNLLLDGWQSWIGGKYAVYALPNVGATVGKLVTIAMGRYEQAGDTNGYAIRWEGACHQLEVGAVNLGVTSGFYGRNIRRLSFKNSYYEAATGVALDIDGTCDDLILSNTYFNNGTTVNLSSFEEVDAVPKVQTSSPLPPSCHYVRTATAGRFVGRFGTRESKKSTVLAVGGTYVLQMSENSLLKTGTVRVSAYSATGPISEFGLFHVDPTGTYLRTGTTNMATVEAGGKLALAFGAINNIVLVSHLAAPITVFVEEDWTV